MSKNKKLPVLLESMSSESLDVLAILESLITLLENYHPSSTLLEIAKRKLTKVFKKIEKTRTILNMLD